MKKILLALFCLVVANAIFGQKNTNDDSKSHPVQRSEGYFIGNIAPLSDPSPAPPALGKPGKMWEKKNYFAKNKTVNDDALPQNGDPLLKNQSPERGGTPIFPGVNVEGLRETGAFPPDPTGDIGKNHYVQATNQGGGAVIKIWDKNGNLALNNTPTGQKMWAQVGFSSIGDPIVQYDHAAERWIFMEMQGFGNNELLIAISNTSDPTGAWKGYRFQTEGFPDYPKLYVWHNAYFVTVNEIKDGNKASGYALERAALLAGKDVFGIYRFELPTFSGINYQPATGVDWEGGAQPSAASPGYILRMYDDSWGNSDPDHLQVYKIFVNWQTPALNHWEGPQKIPVAPFESAVCKSGSLFECIEQPNGATKITALDDIIMYRAPYRNFGGYESIVLNHVSDISNNGGEGGIAGIRWYELRKLPSEQNWSVFQQGTFAPDATTSRFMSTISQDAQGNIGVGFSVSSKQTFPGLRVTAHRASDPLGTMASDEYTLADGKKSHSTFRWGDYSNLSVDPVDGRTFWFTGEYQPQNAEWGTRVASFQLRRDTFDTRPKVLESPVNSPTLTNAEKVTVQIFNEGLVAAKNVKITMKYQGNFVVKETIAGDIPVGQGISHTFAPTVDMSVPGKTYNFDFITDYDLDQYDLNDSISVPVKKLTSNDAAILGRASLGALTCSSELPFDLIIRNASAVPLKTLEVKYKINPNPEQIFNWSGNLAPGALDTVILNMTGLKNGNNFLTFILANPNGKTDEDKTTDTLTTKFVGVFAGSPMSLNASATSGQLTWEIRNKTTNQLVASGKANSNVSLPQTLCIEENKCYILKLTASPVSWDGNFEFYDIFNQLLVKRTKVSGTEIIEFCTPARKNVDVGAFDILTPKSGGGLKATENVRVDFRNFGKNPQTNVQVRFRVDGGAWQTETLSGTLQPGESQWHNFTATADLSTVGKTYNFEVETVFASDEEPQNDRISKKISNRAARDLSVSDAKLLKGCKTLDEVFVQYSIENNGFQEVDSFEIETFLDGASLGILKKKLNLVTGQSFDFPTLVNVADFNAHVFAVKIISVNGQPNDDLLSNNNQQTTFQVDQNGFPMTAIFSFDGKPQETSWQITDDQNNVILSGSGYDPTAQFLNEYWCLQPEKCYVFWLFDTGSDGMQGSILINNSDGLVWEFKGQDFGDTLKFDFCNKLLCSGFSATATVQSASAVGTNDGKITVHPTGGVPPFYFGLNQSTLFLDSVFTNLPAGNYTIFMVDGNFCEYSFTVNVPVFISTENILLENRVLKISPNPTKNFVKIEIPARFGEQNAIADVFDASGKMLFAIRLSRWDDHLQGIFSLENRPAGQYFVRVKGLEKLYFGKLVKN